MIKERRGWESALLCSLFFFSGLAALIYEVVWFSMLRLVIGGSALSLGFLLAGYMGGLCLGSLGYSRLKNLPLSPLRRYALMESGIGLLGLLIPFLMPLISEFYVGTVTHGPFSFIIRAAVGAILLIPPTMLMGATLPAVADHLETSPHRTAKVGYLYAANILGAVAGCLGTGFILLQYGDTWSASLIAVSINLIIAVVAWVYTPDSSPSPPQDQLPESTSNPSEFRWIYVVLGLSGLTALGAQVLWTRLLSLLFGPTVFAFTIILAVFLIGLSLGSALGSWIAKRNPNPIRSLWFAQCALIVSMPICYYLSIHQIPFWSPFFGDWRRLVIGEPMEMVFKCVNDLLQAGVVMGLPTLSWGASFPLAIAVIGNAQKKASPYVARLYAVNTVGSILGALLFSLWLIPTIGTQNGHYVLLTLSAFSACLMLPALNRTSRISTRPGLGPSLKWSYATMTFLSLMGAAMVYFSGPLPSGLIGFGWQYNQYKSVPELFKGEGMNASVAVTQPEPNKRLFHVNGKTVASDAFQDKRLQRLLGHLPALLHPSPDSVLIVGMGTGMTAGTFATYPGFERIVLCEIEGLVVEAASKYFKIENNAVVQDDRTQVVIDDARHYLSVTKEKFDIITSDPINPWVHGAAALYSEEYYELVKAHLNPGGLVSQWVPLYPSSLEAIKCELATFIKAFPNATFWYTHYGDIVMLGQVGPAPRLNASELQSRMINPSTMNDLKEVGIHEALDLLKTYWCQSRNLETFLKNAVINQDRSLHLEYLVGWTFIHNNIGWMWRHLEPYRTYPEHLVTGSEEQLLELRTFMETPL